MITNITLENFKCFRHVSINPKLLTVLIGPNGTGKSSVLQALLLLKQSVGKERLQFQGELINLSAPEDLDPIFLPKTLPIHIELQGRASNNPMQDKREFQYSSQFLSYMALAPARSVNPFEHSANSLPGIFSPVTPMFERLRFVPAARGLVRPKYPLGDHAVEQVSSQRGLGVQEEQLATNLGYSRASEERLSPLLKKITGTGLRAETVPTRAVDVKSLTPSGAVNMVAEGFGANALIQLLHQLITAEKGATVLIEEPEIHLHPKAQADLAEVMAETAKADDKQIIMTTHSEHILSRLLTLVAEKNLSPSELAIYSFTKDDKGECSATEIEVTELGQVTGGLTGFFDANLDEMDRYVKALQNQS